MRNIALFQIISEKDPYENVTKVESFLDLIADKKCDVIVIGANFISDNLNDTEFEDFKEQLEALGEYNDVSFVFSQKVKNIWKTIMTIPYKESVILEKGVHSFEIGKDKKANVIHINEELKSSYNENELNFISGLKIKDDDKNLKNIFFASSSKLGSFINFNKTYSGGNCEGYIIVKI